MTLNNSTRSISYPGAGSAGPFAFPFKIFDQAHLIVTDTIDATAVETTLALLLNYTVDGVGRASGNVTLVDPLPVGHTLKIRRAPPLTQLTSIRDQGPYFPNVVEDRFDLMVMQIQGTTDDIELSLQSQIDALDARLDIVEAEIATLLLGQAGAALPVPLLLDAASDDVQDDGATLRWMLPSEWQIDISTDGTFATMAPGFPKIFNIETSSLEHIVAALEPETQYFARVRMLDTNGTAGPISNVITFLTDPLFVGQGGDLVTFDGVYSRHYFFSSGNFQVLEGSRRVRALIVAGGGSGGSTNGSGVACGAGGGGGVRDIHEADWAAELTPGVYPVVVGVGGVAPNNTTADNGDDSSFNGKTAVGGGKGGSVGGAVGDGGSGGGAVNSAGGPESKGRGTTGQGYDGGIGNAGAGGGGGGGGATEGGGDGTAATGGKGGDGIGSDIDETGTKYGAGGGGCIPEGVFGELPGTTRGLGGDGGGGRGATDTIPATAGTGYGAGGGGTNGGPGPSGHKGIVVIKYKGHAFDVTEPVAPPGWRGPILLATSVIDGVTVDVTYWAAGTGGAAIQSSDLITAISNRDNHQNFIGFHFSRPIRAFRATHIPHGGTQSEMFAADTGGGMGVSSLEGQGIAHSAWKYPKFFSRSLENRREIFGATGDAFSCVVFAMNAWSNVGVANPDTWKDIYFLLADDPDFPGMALDTDPWWQPPEA